MTRARGLGGEAVGALLVEVVFKSHKTLFVLRGGGEGEKIIGVLE